MHMKCKNLEICKKKYEKWRKNQERFIPLGTKEHELFLKYFEKDEATLILSRHTDKRQFERVVSTHDINDIIKHGWVIERNLNNKTVTLIILGYTRTYRPIHLVCKILDDKTWKVKTVYSPISKKYKWSKDFQKRICFCKEN